MTEKVREASPLTGFVLALLLGPLAAPSLGVGVMLAARRVIHGDWIEAEWAVLLWLGPTLPLYLAILPLLPMLLSRARRRGPPGSFGVLAIIIGLQLLIDLALYARAG